MGLRMEIVGSANVASTTLFNALTKTAAAQAAKFSVLPPIENRTVGESPAVARIGAPLIKKLAEIAGGPKQDHPHTTDDVSSILAPVCQRRVPKAKDLGNPSSLQNIRETDAIAPCCCAVFEDGDGTHVRRGAFGPVGRRRKPH